MGGQPIVTFRGGWPCVGLAVCPVTGDELAVTAATFEEAFRLFGEKCPPSYLPIPVEDYADTDWLDRLRGSSGSR